jgi:hypothetical protein
VAAVTVDVATLRADTRLPGVRILIANHRDPVTTSHRPGGKPEWTSSDDHRHEEIGMSDLAAVRTQVGLPRCPRSGAGNPLKDQ